MARDKKLEELIDRELGAIPGMKTKAMFGGWAWLLNGNLLCCAHDDGLLVRLGKGNDAWALQTKGIAPMLSRGRPMQGWVQVTQQTSADVKIRHKLITSALSFVMGLDPK